MLLEKIIALCEAKGISVAFLEKALGIGNGTIRAWDQSVPRADSLKRVADYFQVTMDYLMSDE